MALSVDRKSGRLRVSEADITATLSQLLQLRGWTEIITPAESFLPSGARVHRRGHADRAYVREVDGGTQFFFAEFKRPDAVTKAQHRAEQAEWELEMRVKGFTAYRCPDGCADPVADFGRWYADTWGEAL